MKYAQSIALAVRMGGALVVACMAQPARAAELEALVGEYYQGDGLGVNWTLTITPEGTFTFTWDGCLGRYAESAGSVVAAEGVLALRPSTPPDDGPWRRVLSVEADRGVVEAREGRILVEGQRITSKP